MRIARLILRCSDLNRSVAFWRDLVGLDLVNLTPGFAFFEAKPVQLVLNVVPEERVVASLTEVVFEAKDIRDVHRRLTEQGVPFEVDPRAVVAEGNRQLLATHFRDPDGNLASLTGWVEGPSGS